MRASAEDLLISRSMTNKALICLTDSAAVGALWSRVKWKNLRRSRAQQAAPTMWICDCFVEGDLGRDARRHDCAKPAQQIDPFYRNPHGGLHWSSPDGYAKIFVNTFHYGGFPKLFLQSWRPARPSAVKSRRRWRAVHQRSSSARSAPTSPLLQLHERTRSYTDCIPLATFASESSSTAA
jgi:hypothetical protein